MRARRSGRRSAAALALALTAAAGCGRSDGPRLAPSSSASGSPSAALPVAAPFAPAIAVIDRADAAAEAWESCDAGSSYRELRRAFARAEPLLRAFARRSSEVIYGPARPSDDGAGALGVIDGALAGKDCTRAEAERFQIRSALLLARQEVLAVRKGAAERAAQAASDAAYELGLAILEARPSTSAIEGARRADVHGLTDAVDLIAEELFASPPAARAAIAAPIRRVRRAFEGAPDVVPDRAALARSTGDLGLAVRAAARVVGLRVRTPYRIATEGPDAPVSALTLPPPRRPLDPKVVAIGARLFQDALLSSNRKRSCSSCHQPGFAFTDGMRAPSSLDPMQPLLRNTPTLLYDGLQAVQLMDGRVVTAGAQALRVVHATAELGLDDAELVARAKADVNYAPAFAALGIEIDARAIGDALSAYVSSLGSGSSPMDRFARGDDAALPPTLSRGLDVFVSKGRCARCHVPPLWGGSRPTDFAVPIYASVGVPAALGKKELDPDPGRFGVTGRARDRASFKTPTLRGLLRTRPYFHNGSFPTIEDVVDFYDKGGGRGAGLQVPNQDPDVLPLRLTADERRALIAFLRDALLDAD